MSSFLENMRKFFYTLVFIFICAQPAAAQNERYTHVEIIPERTHNIKPGDTITIATKIKLAPKWHVYWRNPGDSGLPVRIEWVAPEGVIIDKIQWPTPEKITYDILANYGHYNEVVLLQNITITDDYTSDPMHLSATIDSLVCNEICIPESDHMTLTLNDPNAPPHHNEPFIRDAQKKLPEPLPGAYTYTEKDGKLHITAQPESLKLTSADTDMEFFPYEWGILQYTATPQITHKDETTHLIYPRDERNLSELESLKGLLVINDKGYKITALPDKNAQTLSPAANPQITAERSSLTWPIAIALALLGGLILNLMPCVFPVLSMKALSLVKLNEKEAAHARIYGLSYTAGIVLSFLALGLVFIALKQAGSAIGWGFQLQNPIIVALLAYLLFAIGLNLMGFLEIMTRTGNIGSALTQGNSALSSFFTGALVTFVAAPCIGPFLGAAMGFALTQPPAISLAFFTSLGLGLASPYLLFSFIPGLRKILPKPGAWMNVFKQLLAFPMFASSIVFIWVLAEQTGSYGALLALCGLLLISFTAWLAKLGKSPLTTALIILSVITLGFATHKISTLSGTAAHTSEKITNFGKTYTSAALEELLKENDPVFVEMTAAWCFTCKINHAIAINVNTTKALFKQKNVHYLIGDWTNYNTEITEYLATFGRNGVPLYVYYGPRDTTTKTRPEPVLLPQVLTPGIVQETIGQK